MVHPDAQILLKKLSVIVAQSDRHLHILEHAVNPAQIEILEDSLNTILTATERTAFSRKSDLLSDFISFCSQNRISEHLTRALQNRKNTLKKRNWIHQHLVKTLWLSAGARNRKITFLQQIKIIQVTKLKKSYPPRGEWVCESQEIHDLWSDHLAFGKQADGRLPRHDISMLETQKLKHDILPHESVIFKDGNLIVGIFLRNFCEDEKVLKWVDDVVQESIGMKKSARLEDAGKMCLIGYSAGSRKAKQFHWAKNLSSTKFTQEKIDKLDFESSSVFALFWNMAKTRFPDAIIKDTTDFFTSIGACGMDADSGANDTKGIYGLEVDGLDIEFHGVDLAPPMGVFASNYAKPIHNEHHPHNYAFAWTTGRRADKGHGGHFYLAKYGIRIQSAANTAFCWRPKDDHGTSLQMLSPLDRSPAFVQTGLSIVTSRYIKLVWKRYMETQVVEELDESETEYESEETDE